MERSGVRAEQKLPILRFGTGRALAQVPRGVVALDRKPAAQSLDRLRCGLFHHDVSAPPSGEGSRNSLMGRDAMRFAQSPRTVTSPDPVVISTMPAASASSITPR